MVRIHHSVSVPWFLQQAASLNSVFGGSSVPFFSLQAFAVVPIQCLQRLTSKKIVFKHSRLHIHVMSRQTLLTPVSMHRCIHIIAR